MSKHNLKIEIKNFKATFQTTCLKQVEYKLMDFCVQSAL